MIHLAEITGAEQEIVNTKAEGQFTYEELIYLGEDPSDYEVVAYMPLDASYEMLYQKLYSKQ